MSRIQRIFDKNSDSESSDFSDFSDSEVSDNEQELEDDEQELENNSEEEEEENDETDDEEEDEARDDDNETDDENEEEEETNDVNDNEDSDDFEFDSNDEESDDEKEKIVRKHTKNQALETLLKVNEIKEKRIYNVNTQLRETGKKFLSKFLEDDTREIEKLEKSMFNYCVRVLRETNKQLTLDSKCFKEKYSFELYSIMSHLKENMEVDDIRDFYLQDKEHFDRKTFEKERVSDEKKLRLITHVSEPVSGIHKCKCGCDKVYSYELQTRSGDEGMTVFLQCYSCGRKWKL